MKNEELQNLLKFLKDTVKAIEEEQETPERLEERIDALETIWEIEQELLKLEA